LQLQYNAVTLPAEVLTMPLYDFTCDGCQLTFEVGRSFADSDVPAHCPVCDRQARREFSAPVVNTGARADSGAGAGGRASGGASWSHFGHSHGAGARGHSHGGRS